jgi:hypothetical protein
MRIPNLHLLTVLLLSCAMSLSGCASPKAVIPVSVLHNRIEASPGGRRETIVVKPFLDSRKESQRPYIGETREPVNVYPLPPVLIPVPSGKFIVEKNGANVAEILTGYFAEALKGAGYKVLFSTPASLTQLDTASISPNAVFEGEVNEFWLTPSWTTKHLIRVQLKLYNKEGNRLLWEKEIRAQHSEFVGLWSSATFEEVIKKALDKSLHQAAKEFVSDEFQQKVSEN